jgi:hypothetical protein
MEDTPTICCATQEDNRREITSSGKSGEAFLLGRYRRI